ncbi:methanol oxidation system protein MoxJ [Hyphomicrobium methylovorum]|uniref:methanol oxidation system protein MoxJ n=1 Tax=Hyphomicrobium methylovorum TaxID=84 RepID=UPI0015E67D7C|nr:methanol oxidation system protein MoxJ [Hyphomicrobium methylovorum]MBA2125301.1 methanol oxidation system protein MoxJ [Hyphomicrobium methylovorum]
MLLKFRAEQDAFSAAKIAGTVFAVGVSVAALVSIYPAFAQEAASTPVDTSTLRVCAAANEAPYSVMDESGYENKIAKVLAEALNRKVQFVWSPKPAIYAVRDQLDKNLCDVVIGVDTGDERVLTSHPYYKASYVFVQRTDSPLKIDSWKSPDLHKAGKISFVQGTPADVMMNEVDLYNDNINYVSSLTNFKDKRNAYTRVPPQRMIGEVADKTADLAVAFAPEVARYVKSSGALKMTLVPDDNVRSDGQHVPFQFDQSVAVRKSDKDLLAAIDKALPQVQSKIEAILTEEGIPFVSPPPRT